MGYYWKTTNTPLFHFFFFFFFFFFSSSGALFGTVRSKAPCLDDMRCSLTRKAEIDHFHESSEKVLEKMNAEEIFSKKKNAEEMVSFGLASARRFLSGPGSWPPRCTLKCGQCTPCKPVHMPVPPGTPVTEEYYPEAWRCKCGNGLYMP